MRLAIVFSFLTTKQFDGIENIQKKCLFSYVNLILPDCLQISSTKWKFCWWAYKRNGSLNFKITDSSVLVNSISNCLIMYKNLQKSISAFGLWMETLSMFLRKWTLKFQNKFFSFGSLCVLVNSILNCLIINKICKILHHMICEINSVDDLDLLTELQTN